MHYLYDSAQLMMVRMSTAVSTALPPLQVKKSPPPKKGAELAPRMCGIRKEALQVMKY